MFAVTLIDDDGKRVEVSISTRDILKYERAGGDLSKITKESPLVEQLSETYKLAHMAAVRTRLFSDSLAKFEETYDLELEDDDTANLPSDQEA